MTKLPPWRELQRGLGCPFDAPRTGIDEFMHPVRKLTVSTLFLTKEQTYRGACVLIFDPRHVTRIDELGPDEWSAFADDLGRAERAVFRAFAPDHVNVASLGSLVPHLHWHIIPRYEDDPRWGGPVWTTLIEEMPRTFPGDAECLARVAAVNRAFGELE